MSDTIEVLYVVTDEGRRYAIPTDTLADFELVADEGAEDDDVQPFFMDPMPMGFSITSKPACTGAPHVAGCTGHTRAFYQAGPTGTVGGTRPRF